MYAVLCRPSRYPSDCADKDLYLYATYITESDRMGMNEDEDVSMCTDKEFPNNQWERKQNKFCYYSYSLTCMI